MSQSDAFNPMMVQMELWSALDALVLKAIAIVLSRRLNFSRSCCHLLGHGGAKQAVRDVVENLDKHKYVFRTDVKKYFASINHSVLRRLIRQRIDDPQLLDLLSQYLGRTLYEDGIYRDVTVGISLGCPVSPVMAALYLSELDERMEQTGLFYVRFMDDWVILAPTHWKLRTAVRIVNQTLQELQVEQHPDKTFIGKIARGFDFLGYHIKRAGLVGVVGEASV